jgi:hypothetical protein
MCPMATMDDSRRTHSRGRHGSIRALVQAYLHVNGYFIVAEYPVLEAYRDDDARRGDASELADKRVPDKEEQWWRASAPCPMTGDASS